MEEQDKFNQPNENEPHKQPIEQPQLTADTQQPTVDATTQSTSDETVDSDIVWDPKRPGCPDLKYYKRYWSVGLYTALLILGILLYCLLQYNFGGLNLGGSFESGDPAIMTFDILCFTMLGLSLILPPAILSLKTSSAFRWRKPNAVSLYRSQVIWNLILLSGLLFLSIPAFSKYIIPEATGHFDCYLFTIDCNRYLDMALGIGLWLLLILFLVGDIYNQAARLVDSETDKDLIKLFRNRKSHTLSLSSLFFLILPPSLALTIIPLVLAAICGL